MKPVQLTKVVYSVVILSMNHQCQIHNNETKIYLNSIT